MVASTILSKVFAPSSPDQSNLNAQQPNPGNRQQLAPAGDNKVPVVYGSAYVGGIVTDLSITEDNQDIYWVITLSEVTNTETGGTPDTFTFGNVYWGGKKVIFGSGSAVTGLLDESTNELEFTELIQQFERIEKLHTDAIASCKSIERQLKDHDIIYVNYMGKRYTFDEMLDELHETAVYNLQTGNTFGSLLLGALEGTEFE
jgi:hypothetical protein